MPRPTALLLPLLAAPLTTACTDAIDPTPPGLLAPSCTMTYQAYRIDHVRLPESNDEARALALDIDPRADITVPQVDNRFGQAHVLITGIAEAWNVNPAIDAHLARGDLGWALELGTCADGDEVRVALMRTTDRDGDGRLEVVDRGLPSVGLAGDLIATADGVGVVPVGYLTDGAGDLATDTWQLGLGLATELRRDADGGLTGKLGLGLAPLLDAAVAPLAAYATRSIDDVAVGGYWRAQDVDRDGTISTAEVRTFLDTLVRPDVDLGDCDAVACYRLDAADREPDHASLGLGVHAVPVELE
ncbi:MAG: hypothetical protein R3B06_03320 [Kofleriaceae bacterium]